MPPWVLVFSIEGYGVLPEDRLAYQKEEFLETVQVFGLESKGTTAVVLLMKGHTDPRLPDFPKPEGPPPDPEVDLFVFQAHNVHASMEGMRAFRGALKKNLKPGIRVIELDAGFNDPRYVKTVLELFDDMILKSYERE